MGGDNLFFQDCTPIGFLESDQNKAFPDNERALYKHSVTCEKLQDFVLGHRGELIFEVEGFIKQNKKNTYLKIC